MDGNHETSALLPSVSPVTMRHNVSYIPPQVDPMANLSTRAARRNPILLMLQDAFVLLINLHFLPLILLPFKASNPSDELYPGVWATNEQAVQVVLFFAETLVLLFAIPVIVLLPGSISITWGIAIFVIVYLVCLSTRGPKVRYSKMSMETLNQADQHRDERWIFVNGCMVG